MRSLWEAEAPGLELVLDLIQVIMAVAVELVALQRPSQKRCFKQMSSIPL